MAGVVGVTAIARRIHSVRGQKVMLSGDLAALYEVETKALIQAVKRNSARFPPDFMFQLTAQEWRSLRSQIVTLDTVAPTRGGHPKYPPYAFTEQGVAMLSSVLRSERAIEVNIQIMRAFIQLRDLLSGHKELEKKLAKLERKYDGQFKIVFEAIRELMEPSDEEHEKRRIGFTTDSE